MKQKHAAPFVDTMCIALYFDDTKPILIVEVEIEWENQLEIVSFHEAKNMQLHLYILCALPFILVQKLFQL